MKSATRIPLRPWSVDTIFGADFSLYDGIRMNSHLADFDPGARLLNVRYQGKNYTISRQGAA